MNLDYRTYLRARRGTTEPTLIFSKREERRTLIHENLWYYYEDEGLLLRDMSGWEETHHIRAADYIHILQERTRSPRMRYLDRLTYRRRQGKFVLEPLWCPAFGEMHRLLNQSWITGNGDKPQITQVSPTLIAEAERACETRQFIWSWWKRKERPPSPT